MNQSKVFSLMIAKCIMANQRLIHVFFFVIVEKDATAAAAAAAKGLHTLSLK